MKNTLNGKVVVVTGASSGIGEAMAREYAKMGAKVVMAARREEELKRIASEIEAEGGKVSPPRRFFLFDTEQGGRSLPEIKKKDQFDAPKFFG